MATYTNALIVYTNGKLQKIAAADTITFEGSLSGLVDVTMTGDLQVGGDAEIGGNLNVQGAIVSHGAENLLVADPYIGLASNNESATATSGGFTLTLKKATDFVALTAETFVAGVPGTSAPTVTLASGDGASLAAGDVIQISGAANETNNGLHVVQGVAGDVVTIYGIGGTAVPAYAKFLDNQFAAESAASASVVKVDLSVFAISDGNLYQGATPFAVGTPCYIYAPGAVLSNFNGGWSEFGGDVSLQEAYNAGQSILLDSAKGALSVLKPTAGTAAISLQSNAASKFEVVSANLDLYTTTSGNVSVTSAQQFSVSAGDNIQLNSTGGSIQLGNSAANYQIDVGTGGVRKITLGSTDASEVELNADLVDVNSDGAVTVNAAAASNFSVAGGDLTLETTGSGELWVNGATNVTISATGASAAVNIEAADGRIGLGNEDVDHDIYVGTSGERWIRIGSATATDVTLDAVAVSIDASAASNFSVTGAALSLKTLTSGALDVTSAGLMNIDAVGVLSLNSSGAAINIGDDAVTQAINIGTAGARGIYIGNGDASTVQIGADTVYVSSDGPATIDSAGASYWDVAAASLRLSTVTSGNLTVSSAAVLDIDAVGALSINSSGAAINVGDDAVGQAINVGTAGARTITIGSSGATEVEVAADLIDMNSDGAVQIDGAAASWFKVTGANLTLETDTSGTLAVASAGLLNIDSALALSLNSSGAAINIGNDADSFAINIGTGAAARTLTIGNVTGATAIDILAGTGGVDITGNVAVTGYLTASSYLKVGEVAYASFPAAASAGAGAVLWNSTASVLMYSDGAAWKAVSNLDGVTLQLAYDNGNTIVLDNGRALDVSPDAGASAAISLDASAASNFSVAGANLVLETTTTGTLFLASAGLMDVDAGANLDIDVTGSFDVLASAAFSIDGTGASNVSVEAGNLTLATTTSGNVVLNSAAVLDMDGASMTLDVSGGMSLDAAATSNISVAGAALTIETVTSGALELDSAGVMDLDAASALSLNSAGGAINIGNDDVAQAINIGTDGDRTITIGQSAGGSTVQVYSKNGAMVLDATGQTLNVDAATVDIASSGGATHTVAGVDGVSPFKVVTAGTDKFRVTGNVQFGAFVSHNLSENAAAGSPFGAIGLIHPIGTLATTGVQIGHVLYLASDGVMKKADCVTNNEVVGLSGAIAQVTETAGIVTTMPGSIALMQFEAGTATTAGAPVYLSATAGKATQTPPTSGRVFKLGILRSTTSNLGMYPVLWMPQFIADL